MGGVTTPVRATGLTWQEVGAEIVVFDGEHLQRLAGSAAAIWRCIDDIASVAQIVSELRELFGAEVTLGNDVPAFVAKLVGSGLVRLEAWPPGRFRIPATVAWARDGQRIVLADLRTSVRAALSESAALVWEIAGEGLTRPEVVQELTAALTDPPDSLANDVTRALQELVASGWLRAG